MDYSTIYRCRVCESKDLVERFSLGEHRLSAFLKPDDPPAPIVPLTFVWCRGCKCLQQRHTARPEVLHRAGYWYRSSTTQAMQDALRDVSVAAAQKVDLRGGGAVLDLGSNDGTLLRCFGKHLVRVGVEPRANLHDEGCKGISLLIPHAWGTTEALSAAKLALNGTKAKVITALGMFYSVDNPDTFIRDCAGVLHDDGVLILQLMTLPDTLAAEDYGNLCHEHLVFYSLTCLERLLHRHGLWVFDQETNSVNGMSTRIYAGHCKSMGKNGRVGRLFEEDVAALEDGVSRFKRRTTDNVTALRETLYKEAREDRAVYVLGASTKGNTILQAVGVTRNWVKGAADRDPRKHGLVTSAGQIPIVSEEEAIQHADTFLVLPYAFREEIVARLKGQGWSGRLIFPMPKVEVVHV